MHALTLPLLRRLSDGAFHSGERLAVQFGVSRASICNALKDVHALGICLYKVRGRGYRLAESIEWLDSKLVAEYLENHEVPITMQMHDVVTSTNTILMQQAAGYAGTPICVTAEVQTQGKGRRGKVWHSPLGGALTFSLLWQFNRGASQLSGLSLAVGVGLVRSLKEIGIENIQLKWPNDLMLNFHKLGGILVELQGDALGPSSTVIGIGLNVHLGNSIKNRIDQAVTDIKSISNKMVSRNQLLAITLRQMIEVLQEFEKGGFQVIQEEWQQYHAYHEREVTLHMGNGSKLPGVVKGVTAEGCLMMQTAQGLRVFGSGEVSLRPREKTDGLQ